MNKYSTPLHEIMVENIDKRMKWLFQNTRNDALLKDREVEGDIICAFQGKHVDTENMSIIRKTYCTLLNTEMN